MSCFHPPYTARLVAKPHDTETYYIGVIAAADDMTIAEVFDPISYSAEHKDEILKLTRLFAAAPELLAALEDCAMVLDSANRHTGGTCTAFIAVLEKARNAITEATA